MFAVAKTHPVVEGVLGPGHAAVVTAVGLRRDHAGGVEGSVEGGGGRASRGLLTVDGGGAGRVLLQGQRGIGHPTDVHLLPGCSDV